MDVAAALRTVDSYCDRCGDVIPHTVLVRDPGACTCSRCGSEQQMMVPLD